MSRRLTPTTLTVRELEARGYLVDIVERRVGGVSHDLFGIFDVVGVLGDETIAVQSTDITNVAARVRKCGESPNIERVRSAGWTLAVHGWRSDGRLREIDIS